MWAVHLCMTEARGGRNTRGEPISGRPTRCVAATHPLPHHLKSETEVVFYSSPTPFVPLPPPSHAKASRRWSFDFVRPPTSSLACKSEPEEGFNRVSTLFEPSPPPPSCATARRRWVSMGFRPRSAPRHPPRVQQRDAGGFSTPFGTPPPPSRPKVRRRWVFDPIRHPTTSIASKSETEMVFCGVSTPFGTQPPRAFVSWVFEPVCGATTSLASKSKPGVFFLSFRCLFYGSEHSLSLRSFFYCLLFHLLYLLTSRRRDYPFFGIICLFLTNGAPSM